MIYDLNKIKSLPYRTPKGILMIVISKYTPLILIHYVKCIGECNENIP